MATSLPMNDTRRIPQIGLGTWPLKGEEAAAAVSTAIGLGYRLIDTAARYANESDVGEGVRRSGVDRETLFITTKLDGVFQGNDRAVLGLSDSLKRLGMEYVDLLLIHWPLPARGEFVSTWKTFIRLRDEGLARSIGVSNFKPAHLEALADETGIVPAVNQIQLSPAIPRTEERLFHRTHGIITQCWSPILNFVDRTELQSIAERYGRTPAQVILRWHVQNGLVPIPKSKSPKRQAENLDVFNFKLSEDDIALLALMDKGPFAGVNSDKEGH